MTETWKPIPGWETTHVVSDQGRVRSLDRRASDSRGFTTARPGVHLKGSPMPSGHLRVVLARGGQRSHRFIHHLVLEAFVGPRPEGMEGCHNDGDPANNALDNLRWDTRAANQADAVRHGAHASVKKTHCPQGHEYTPENTYTRNGKSRHCRACQRARDRRRRSIAKHIDSTDTKEAS